MTWLNDKELEKYSKIYNNIKNKTRESYQGKDDDLWVLAQSHLSDYTGDGKADPIESAKIAAAAIHTVGDDINWNIAKQRINKHVFSNTMDSYSPLHYSVQASDEIVNHAVACQLRRELDGVYDDMSELETARSLVESFIENSSEDGDIAELEEAQAIISNNETNMYDKEICVRHIEKAIEKIEKNKISIALSSAEAAQNLLDRNIETSSEQEYYAR